MEYYCEKCEKEVNDNGPYERSNGEYYCQDCMEDKVARDEAAYDDHVDLLIDEAKLKGLE